MRPFLATLSLCSTALLFSHALPGADYSNTGGTLSFTAFSTTSDGVFSDLPECFYAILDGADSQSGVSFLAVGPLAPINSDGSVWGGDYDAVDSGDDSVSSGVIGFKFTETPDGDYPVVGYIPLSGGFDSVISTTPDSNLGGSSADFAWDADIGVARVAGDSFTSYLPYILASGGDLYFEAPFSVGDQTFYYGIIAGRDDGSYTGLVYSDFSESSLADSMYMIRLTGASDLFDESSYWFAGADYDATSGWLDSGWFGDFVFSYPPRSGASISSYDPDTHSYLWHEYHGWLYSLTTTGSDSETWALLYDYRLGWLATSESTYPYFYAYDATIDGTDYGASWLYYSDGTGASDDRYFYAFSDALSSGSNCGYTGWWTVEGAN